jgi:hypothetical protein
VLGNIIAAPGPRRGSLSNLSSLSRDPQARAGGGIAWHGAGDSPSSSTTTAYSP